MSFSCIMKSVEERKIELKDKLENELYVERFFSFKESLNTINNVFNCFNIKFQYDYNGFCSDFTKECLDYLEKNPDIDMTSPKEMMMCTFPIFLSMIEKKKKLEIE